MPTPVVDMDKVAKRVAVFAREKHGVDLGRVTFERRMWRSEKGPNPGQYVTVQDASGILNSVVSDLDLGFCVRDGTALVHGDREAKIIMITTGKHNSHWGLFVYGKFVVIQAVGSCLWMSILTGIHVLLEPEAMCFFENRTLRRGEEVASVQVGSLLFHVFVDSKETAWWLRHKRPVPAPRPSRLTAAVGANAPAGGGGRAPTADAPAPAAPVQASVGASVPTPRHVKADAEHAASLQTEFDAEHAASLQTEFDAEHAASLQAKFDAEHAASLQAKFDAERMARN